MNILLIINTNNNIFKVDSGAALRNNLFVKALSQIGHVDVICFTQDNVVSNIPNCDVIFSKVILDDKDYMEAFRSLLCMTLWPLNPYSYYQVNKHKAAIVNDFIEQTDYDIIACRYVESAIKCGLLENKEKLVIDVDDNPVSVLLFSVAEAHSKLKKWKKQYEARRIGRMVENLLGNIRCSFCSNPLEMPSSRTVYLHNTTILKRPTIDNPKSEIARVLFVGFLNFFPNNQGILHFVESIFPQIRDAMPHVELRIVGGGRPEFLAYLNEKEGVNAIGIVDDLVHEYQQASVVVIPVYYGSGTCVKFVEALFMNCPIVSTPVGARGFSYICRDGKDYMLANNDEEFVSKTIELLSSEARSKEMANNGYEIARSHYSQESFLEIVKNNII